MVVPPTYYTHRQNHYICAYAPAREFHSFHAKYYLCKILIINIYEKWSKKSTNCTITFECEDLGIKITAGKFSQKLQKHIDLFEQPPGRCVITGSHKELIELLVSLWDKGQLTLPGKNNINHLADFIFRYYDLRYENDPEESMSLESIRSETYFYHEPE